MLRFFTLDQADIQPFQSEFRYRVLWTAMTLAGILAVGLVSAIGVVNRWGTNWGGVAILGWFCFWSVVFAALCQKTLRARLRPSAWLVRIQTDGLLVKFRSYLNYHFPSDDLTVFSIPFCDIEWMHEDRIEGKLLGTTREDDMRYRHRCAELKVANELTSELHPYLARERELKSGRSFSRHYPVQIVNEGVVRIEWEVQPSLEEFLREVGQYVSVRPTTDTFVDFTKLKTQPKPEQERRLIELVEAGNRIDAVRTARYLYDFNLNEAVRFIDELAGQKRK